MMDSKGHVLLVDGETTARSPATRLRSFGYHVTRADVGDDGLERLDDGAFDLIIRDAATADVGSSFVRPVRQLRIALPIILLLDGKLRELTARDQGVVFQLARAPDPLVLEQTAVRAIALYRKIAGLRDAVATLRNVSAKQVEIEEVSATDARNDFAHMLETVSHRGVVVINKQNAPKAVMVSFDEFCALVARPVRKLDTLSAGFDKMLAEMQTAAARAGMKAAFDATPEEQGAAAVAGAGARRRLG